MAGDVELYSEASSIGLTKQHTNTLAALGVEASRWPSTQVTVRREGALIYTDASNSGGAFVVGKTANIGHVHAWEWPTFLTEASINVKELLAISHAVEYAKLFSLSPILILTDSQVSICALLKGASASESINQTIKKIFSTCLDNQIEVAIDWIPTEQNPADAGSRNVSLDKTELSLSEPREFDPKWVRWTR